MYFLGIDGGGTKTDFLLIDENGSVISQQRIGTISYKHIGMENSIDLLKNTIGKMLSGVKAEVGICLAMPTWGESPKNDRLFKERQSEISGHPVLIVNDCVVGWAGSLGLESGINLVAGTGSIAYGRKTDGKEARAGGWDDCFSDEGSCHWLGKRALELFSKESDGRKKAGPLLELMREYFSLENDMDIIDIFEKSYKNNRTKIAGLQKILLQAAREGDKGACSLYEEAALELAMIVRAVYDRLGFQDKIAVSYSGGLFHAGELVLAPLREHLEDLKIELVIPRYSPVQGAVFLAADYWGSQENLDRIRRKFNIDKRD